MAYKQNPKSPILKALVGNQHKLPQHLQDAIKAAPESPAKRKGPKPGKQKKTAKQAAKEMGDRAMQEAKKRRQAQLNQPESPAKKNNPGDKRKSIKKGTINAARQMLKDSTGINNPNLSDAEVIRAAKTKGIYQEASSQAKRAAAGGDTKYGYSPAKKYKK